MKVGIVNITVYPFHKYGGVEKYIFFFSRALAKLDVDVEIVTSLPNTRIRGKELGGVKYTFIPPQIDWSRPFALSPSLDQLFFFLKLTRYLETKDFDVLHCYNSALYIYLYFKNRSPVVYQPFERIYDMYDFRFLLKKEGYDAASMRGMICYLAKYLDRYCVSHADAIAIEGEAQEIETLKQLGVENRKIFRLPTGVDIFTVHEAINKATFSRKDLNLTDEDFVLISVNRLEPSKGINYLITALKLVRQEVANAKLIIVGTGSELGKIRRQIMSYQLADSIVHLQSIHENLLYKLYALSDVYVSPSLERSSITGIIEGMACGLPVVSTGQDYWVKSGINGYVVPKRDPKAIARAIFKIYDKNKRKEFGDKSLEIAERFDYKVIAQMAIEKYRELMKD